MRGVGALGAGELLIRLSRVVTAIVLARMLDPVELGVAATAITCFELVRILASNGLGQMVIRAHEERLQATCNSAYRVMWIVCLAMVVLQIAVGAVVAHLAGRPELLAMIGWLAGVYLVMPWGVVQYWLLQRQERMGALSAVNSFQVTTDNLLTALLAAAGLGAWSVVLPKLLMAPVWTIGMRRAAEWHRDRAAGHVPPGEIIRFCAPVLASEVLAAVRVNADKLLVAAILGLEALGIYYFAFSAGYGLSLVLTSALASAGFAHLADQRLTPRQLLERFDQACARLARPISILIAMQALAIFVYVPLLFGARWEPYTPIVAVLCLSAVTKPSFDLSAQLLRAAGKPAWELAGSVIVTAALLGLFAAALPHGLLAGVAVLSGSTVILQLAFTAWARSRLERTVPLPDPSTLSRNLNL